MKALLVTVALLLASSVTIIAASPLAPLPTAHIILIAGQSNAVGCNTDPFTAEDAIVDRIWQLQVSEPTLAKPLTPVDWPCNIADRCRAHLDNVRSARVCCTDVRQRQRTATRENVP